MNWRVRNIGLLSNQIPSFPWVGKLLGVISVLAAGALGVGKAGTPEPFTIVVLPDTQHYADNATNYAHFANQTRWIANNRIARNIAFVTHVGDIVENNGIDPLQWARADRAFRVLDAIPSLAYGVALGNHDYDNSSSNPNDSAETYLSYFGPDRYAENPWYGGFSPNGRSHWQRFYAGGRVFLHLSLEWRAASLTNSNTTEVTAWAQAVLDAHPDTPTIISTHEYLGLSGRLGAGEELFNALVNQNAQVFLIVGGHELGENHRTVANAAGRRVYEILVDFQGYPEGGQGYMLLLEFDEANNAINASTYSPSLDAYKLGALSQYRMGVPFQAQFGPGEQPIPLWWGRPQESTVAATEAQVRVGLNQNVSTIKVACDSLDRGTSRLDEWAHVMSLPAWTGGAGKIDATLSGLAPGSRYCYRFVASNGGSGDDSWSEAGTFETEPILVPTPFEEFMEASGLSGPAAEAGADPDEDSLSNLEEFSWGLDPTRADRAVLRVEEDWSAFLNGTPLTEVRSNPARVVVSYVRRVDFATSGLTYAIQFSKDLVNWATAESVPTVLLRDEVTGYELVRVEYPIINGEVQFHRIMVSLE